MNELQCPTCGSVEFRAIEQYTSMTPCRLIAEDGSVEIEFSAAAEMVRDAATSVTILYACAKECGFTVEPANLNTLGVKL